MAPLSLAALAPNAQTAEAAAKAAVAYINSHGGVLGHPVELTVEDDGGDPTTGITKLESAINSGNKPAIFLQADASSEAAAELPILAQNHIVSFNEAPTATSGDPTKFPENFDLSPSTPNYAAAFCPYVKAHGGKSVAILHGNDAYGDPLAQAEAAACKSDGVTVTGTQQFELTSLDMTPQLEALQSGHPDYLLLQAYGPPAGYVLQDIQKLGWNVPILGDDSVMVSPVITSPPPSGQLGSPTETNLKCEVFRARSTEGQPAGTADGVDPGDEGPRPDPGAADPGLHVRRRHPGRGRRPAGGYDDRRVGDRHGRRFPRQRAHGDLLDVPLQLDVALSQRGSDGVRVRGAVEGGRRTVRRPRIVLSVTPSRGADGYRGMGGPIFPSTIAAISPGLACRPSAAFEKISSPSRVTSNRPFDDGVISSPAMIGAQPVRSSSARPTARGT